MRLVSGGLIPNEQHGLLYIFLPYMLLKNTAKILKTIPIQVRAKTSHQIGSSWTKGYIQIPPLIANFHLAHRSSSLPAPSSLTGSTCTIAHFVCEIKIFFTVSTAQLRHFF